MSMSINRKRGSIDLARSLCYQINGAADDSDDMDGGGYGSVDIAEILSAEVVRLREALAQPEQNIAALVEGMEVSIDVSTGEHDSGHRLFGVVDLVQENQGSKHGLILLVQEPEANFKEALAQPKPVAILFGSLPVYDTALPQRTWVGLTRIELIKCGVLPYGMSYELYQAIEAKLKDKNS